MAIPLILIRLGNREAREPAKPTISDVALTPTTISDTALTPTVIDDSVTLVVTISDDP